MAMVIFPLEGCNLQVAGQNLEKNCPERFTDLPKLLKTEHYNDVLVISYSSQGHAKPGNIRSQFYKLILQCQVFQGKKEGFKIVRSADLITPAKASIHS